MPEAGDGPGWDSETMTGWARILERAPSREIGTRGIAYLKGGAQRRASQHNRFGVSTKRCALTLSRPPALVKAAAPYGPVLGS